MVHTKINIYLSNNACRRLSSLDDNVRIIRKIELNFYLLHKMPKRATTVIYSDSLNLVFGMYDVYLNLVFEM